MNREHIKNLIVGVTNCKEEHYRKLYKGKNELQNCKSEISNKEEN